MEQNAAINNIEVTDGNIKAFERTARKYGIDFALKKDSSEQPPRYLVFFKGRDVDVMTQAFKEFSARTVKKQERPSLREQLARSESSPKQSIVRRSRSRPRSEVQSCDRSRTSKSWFCSICPICLPSTLWTRSQRCSVWHPDRADRQAERWLFQLRCSIRQPLPSFHPIDLLVGVAGAACFKLAVYIKSKNRKKFRQGEEYGSARWSA